MSTMSLCTLTSLLEDTSMPYGASQLNEQHPKVLPESEKLAKTQEDRLDRSSSSSSSYIGASWEISRLHRAEANNSSMDYDKNLCPERPVPHCAIGDQNDVNLRTEYRTQMQPDRFKCVTLNFRIMRRDAETHAGTLVNMCGIKRSALYKPVILNRWTRTLRVKIKATTKIAVGFRCIEARLGLQSTIGLKYCLDGFYGVEDYGDAFGNYGPGICPWMEVTGDASPLSLKLEDGDNVFMSVATEQTVKLVRMRIHQASHFLKSPDQGRYETMYKSLEVFHDQNEPGVDEEIRRNSFAEDGFRLEL